MRGPQRPPVSVVVPFRGDADAAARIAHSFAGLQLRAGDELVIADNSDGGEAAAMDGAARIVRATGERSSYHARNVGAAAATGEWLLFTDSDCVPVSGIIDSYFDPPPGDEVGAMAGPITMHITQRAFLARYAEDRNFLDQDEGLHTAADGAATANLLVRRTVFDELGGFAEGIRSGGDVDFCRRLVAAGWTIERRPEARVDHLHRESLPDLLGSIARYAAGARWLNERYPGTAPQWPLVHGLALCARDITVDVARFRLEQAAFRGVDALGLIAHVVGYRRSNAA